MSQVQKDLVLRSREAIAQSSAIVVELSSICYCMPSHAKDVDFGGKVRSALSLLKENLAVAEGLITLAVKLGGQNE